MNADGNSSRPMRAVLHVLMLVSLGAPRVAAAGQTPLLAFVSPANNAVVAPGETITVRVTTPAGAQFTALGLVGEGPFGIINVATSVPAQFTVVVPSNAASRTYSLTAMGRTADNQEAFASIHIDVERPDMPQRISAELPELVFERPGRAASIELRGHFADGSVVDITASPKVTFTTSDPRVATAGAYGRVTGVAVGTARITATYGAPAIRRTTAVSVIVSPGLFAVSPVSLDFGRVTVRAFSSKRTLTLTNTSGKPLRISTLTISGEFSQTNTCESRDLRPAATCAITVIFLPVTAGPRAGTVTVGNDGEVLEFSVTGTGAAPRRVDSAPSLPARAQIIRPIR